MIEVWVSAMVGVLFATGMYCLLRRSIVRTVFGLTLLSHGAHLSIMAVAGLDALRVPLIPEDDATLLPPFADPLPQALVLTAIVINFGLTAFMVALVFRTQRTMGSDDVDEMLESDR